MKVLKFKLDGKTAFFKKPDVNSYYYFTYGNIHKVALLGMFGAILGYGGYNQVSLMKSFDKNKSYDYPEFYEKLKNFKIAIEPINEKGMINKKIQVFNNSVGYASKELGGNLIVKEQWLENPAWNIYIIIDNDEALKLEEYITNNKAIYTPYLGKNDHYANISEIEIIDNISELSKTIRIDSLCSKEKVIFNIIEDDEEDDNDLYREDLFKYSEKLPIELDKDTNMYVLENFVYSNMTVDSIKDIKVYKIKNKNIVFF